MTTNTPTDDRTRETTRRELRARRRALEPSERRSAQRSIARNLLRMGTYRRARAVAVYFGTDGEVDLSSVIAHAQSSGKSIFAPVLARNGLRFIQISTHSVLRRNRFGILEPRGGRRMDPRGLDIVLTPLVAFDRRGNRLGMGKGYYDRVFGFLKRRPHWRKPRLVGIGFDFQKLEHLATRHWDVPLWGAVTNGGIDYFEETTTDELLAPEV